MSERKRVTVEATALVLMHGGVNGHFVDENKLHSGIYSTSNPSMYVKNTTIEALVETATKYLNVGATYIENLKRCELRVAKIIVEFL